MLASPSARSGDAGLRSFTAETNACMAARYVCPTSKLFDAKQGTFIHYAYPTGKAIIGEELAAGIWLRANRPGLQLMARIVLPPVRG